MDDFLPFSVPEIGNEEIEEVLDSLRNGWITTGPKARRFEDDFAAFLGGGCEAVAVNSATAGLHLALEAMGIGIGHEVITTTFTFTATAEVIRYLGADPVLVDIQPSTLNIDPYQIEKAITPRTKAIVPVHFAGLPCDMSAILAIARKHGLAVVEDAAHALPAKADGKIIGTLDSDATVFSFYATKTITTGEGGMIVTRSPEIARRCRVMRLHGINQDIWNRYTTGKPNWYYEVVAPGFKYNLTDIAASLGIHQLRKAHQFHRRRMEIAKKYSIAFRDFPIDPPPLSVGESIHAWHLYVIRLRLEEIEIGRDLFIDLMAKKGIGASVHFIPLHLHPYWRERYGFGDNDFPVALRTYRRCVSLPIYTRMSDTDVQKVICAAAEILSV